MRRYYPPNLQTAPNAACRRVKRPFLLAFGPSLILYYCCFLMSGWRRAYVLLAIWPRPIRLLVLLVSARCFFSFAWRRGNHRHDDICTLARLPFSRRLLPRAELGFGLFFCWCLRHGHSFVQLVSVHDHVTCQCCHDVMLFLLLVSAVCLKTRGPGMLGVSGPTDNRTP